MNNKYFIATDRRLIPTEYRLAFDKLITFKQACKVLDIIYLNDIIYQQVAVHIGVNSKTIKNWVNKFIKLGWGSGNSILNPHKVLHKYNTNYSLSTNKFRTVNGQKVSVRESKRHYKIIDGSSFAECKAKLVASIAIASIENQHYHLLGNTSVKSQKQDQNPYTIKHKNNGVKAEIIESRKVMISKGLLKISQQTIGERNKTSQRTVSRYIRIAIERLLIIRDKQLMQFDSKDDYYNYLSAADISYMPYVGYIDGLYTVRACDILYHPSFKNTHKSAKLSYIMSSKDVL